MRKNVFHNVFYNTMIIELSQKREKWNINF